MKTILNNKIICRIVPDLSGHVLRDSAMRHITSDLP